MRQIIKAIYNLKNRTFKEDGVSIVELMVASLILITVSATVATVIVTTNSQINETATETFFKNKLTVAGKTIAKAISESESIIASSQNSINLKIKTGNTITIQASTSACSITAVEYDEFATIVKTIEIIDALDSCSIFTEEGQLIKTNLQYTSNGEIYEYSTTSYPGSTSETGDVGALGKQTTSIAAFNAKFNNGQLFTFNANIPNQQTPEIQVSGTGPFTYSIYSGQLPDILTFNAETGRITAPSDWNLTNSDYNFISSITIKIEDTSGIGILLPITIQSPKPKPIIATGGTITEYVDDGTIYRVHSFTGVGKTPFSVTSLGNMGGEVDYLIVGGGGAGGSSPSGVTAGGGGAGQVKEGSKTLTVGTKTVVVGVGGKASINSRGNNGSSSSFDGVNAAGGGGGGAWNSTSGLLLPTSGGSGGGGSAGVSARTSNGAAATTGQGNAGGNGLSNETDASRQTAGGGGGAGSTGQNGSITSGGNGGAGIASTITGTSLFYAAGGGGGKRQDVPAGTTAGLGGSGIGGNGGIASTSPTSGAANTGSGGGGAGDEGLGGTGGSGIVIIKYPIAIEILEPPSAPTNLSVSNITYNTATLSWQAPENGSAVKNYVVLIDGEEFRTVPGSQLTTNVNNLTPGEIHEATIRAVNASGYSDSTTTLQMENFAQATGGVITQFEESGIIYKVHTFSNVGTFAFNLTDAPNNFKVEYLIVGGGGAGGSGDGYAGGGGGAGGVLQGEKNLTVGAKTVVVGDGGEAVIGSVVSGDNSSFEGEVALGGGGGGSYVLNSLTYSPNTGGSGGGGGGQVPSRTRNGASGTSNQGNSGGAGFGSDSNGAVQAAGGGGGAGSGGSDAVSANGGAGGSGIVSDITGSNIIYGGGGGGAKRQTTGGGSAGAGGLGGGGAGGFGTSGSNGVDGLGGGGGGAGGAGTSTGKGGNGGSGVVIIKYIAGISTSGFISASGGSISQIVEDDIIYNVHMFTDTGASSLNILSAPPNAKVDYLIVGGGGAGGSSNTGATAGGGGAGQLVQGVKTITVGSKSISVGEGGLAPSFNSRGNNGSSSSFDGVNAAGGGGGGAWNSTSGLLLPTSGGSGGGGSAGVSARTSNGAAATTGQGNAGGNGLSNETDASRQTAGGGGGAGSTGQNGSITSGGNGGAGIASTITGTSLFYAAGGGGGKRQDVPAGTTAGLGGSGIGGNGGIASTSPTSGAANTGSGGGGAGNYGIGGAGGSGIVIVRYPINITLPQAIIVSVPTAPTNINVIPISSSKANVSWDAPANNGGSPIIDYTVEMFSSWNQSTETKTVTGTSAEFDLGFSGGSYSFKVKANNSAGSSEWSYTFIFSEHNSGGN